MYIINLQSINFFFLITYTNLINFLIKCELLTELVSLSVKPNPVYRWVDCPTYVSGCMGRSWLAWLWVRVGYDGDVYK